MSWIGAWACRRRSAPRFVATGAILDISNRIPYGIESRDGGHGLPAVKRSPLSYAFAGVHGISMFDASAPLKAEPTRSGTAWRSVWRDRQLPDPVVYIGETRRGVSP